jgi:hypothetical protein
MPKSKKKQKEQINTPNIGEKKYDQGYQILESNEKTKLLAQETLDCADELKSLESPLFDEIVEDNNGYHTLNRCAKRTWISSDKVPKKFLNYWKIIQSSYTYKVQFRDVTKIVPENTSILFRKPGLDTPQAFHRDVSQDWIGDKVAGIFACTNNYQLRVW